MITNPTATTANKDHEAPDSVQANVKLWTERIRKARQKWKGDFARMRSNMKFAAGKQWESQEELDTERYVCNITIRNVNQKVASLYAKNPRSKAVRRKRLDYQVWDGKMESLVAAIAEAGQNPLDMEAMAIVRDYEQGQTTRELIDRVGETLDTLYQWNIDQQEPEFKKQMKQLVRRTVITGVGYVRLSFLRKNEKSAPTTSDTDTLVLGRAKRAAEILRRIDEGDVDMDDAAMEQLRLLFAGFGMTTASEAQAAVDERLLLDFPPATSIIPDSRCRCLKDFVNAQWIAIEYKLPLDEVNEFFETNIDAGGDLMEYERRDNGQEGQTLPMDTKNVSFSEDPQTTRIVCLWEVFDIRTKTRFFVCDGYKDYVMQPEQVWPETKRFWPVFALTFNDIEPDDEAEVTVFPPSDVQLMKHSQKEWNRSRDALREHRRQNRPKYLAVKGRLTEEDKNKLENVPQSGVIEVEGIGAGEDVSKIVVPFQHSPVDPTLYDVSQLQQDILLSVGAQEANFGPLSGATATEATISEQSRLGTTSSNVDDLDDLLGDVARAGGEVLLRECGVETVKRVCGPGAVWPSNPEDFINEVYLEIEAASSGRPNKAMEIANFERLAPVMMQAGANPQFIVREAIQRLDDRIDPADALPLLPLQLQRALSAQTQGIQQLGQPHPQPGPQQPLQQLQSEAPVPLTAA